jgi:hypothetical protein
VGKVGSDEYVPPILIQRGAVVGEAIPSAVEPEANSAVIHPTSRPAVSTLELSTSAIPMHRHATEGARSERLGVVVAAANFFATPADDAALLNYLGEPIAVSLHRWPVVPISLNPLPRSELGNKKQIMIVSHELGLPRLIRAEDDSAMQGGTRAAVFNRINQERLAPAPGDGLVDSDASPVLLWVRGGTTDALIHQSQIGTQADSPAAISPEYQRWARRVMSWVRRNGTRVWGPESKQLRPDLDIDVHHISPIYALPGALAALEAGAAGRW